MNNENVIELTEKASIAGTIKAFIYSVFSFAKGILNTILLIIKSILWVFKQMLYTLEYTASAIVLAMLLQYYGYVQFEEIAQEHIEQLPPVQWYRTYERAVQAEEIAQATPEEREDLLTTIKRSYTRDELEQIARSAARRYGVPEDISLAFVDIEAAWDVSASRHEPHHVKYCKEFRHPEKQRNCASSHGLYQIMFSIWADKCDLNDFSELYDPRVNAACGNLILSHLLSDTQHIKQLDKRIYSIAKGYNGTNMPDSYVAKLNQSLARRMFAKVLRPAERSEVLQASLRDAYEQNVEELVEVAQQVVPEIQQVASLQRFKPGPDDIELASAEEKSWYQRIFD